MTERLQIYKCMVCGNIVEALHGSVAELTGSSQRSKDARIANAVKGALGRVEEKILEKHFQNCVSEAVKGSSKKEKQQKLDEVLKLIHQTRRG